jgi:outer membrane protein assembly factor BamB
MPQEDGRPPEAWSYIGVYENVLVGGRGFAKYRERLGLSFSEEDGKLSGNKAGFGSKALDRAGSMALVGFDRYTGKLIWQVDARFSFWNNAIVAGRGLIYALDKHPKPVEDKLRRRGAALPNNYRIIAFNAETGKTVWEVEQGVFGTWLGYS